MLAMNNAISYMELSPDQSMSSIEIDTVFVGSCTNGRIEDLRQVASILINEKVHDKINMLIVPGSSRVYKQAVKEGLDKIFLRAGADFRSLAGCSLCVALNADRLSIGKRTLSTSNRNFEGRQGPGVQTHIASPAVAAATAVLGRIGSPQELKEAS